MATSLKIRSIALKTKPRRRSLLTTSVSMAVPFVGLFLLLEIVLRFCPGSEYFPAVPINEENPISQPAFNRSGTWSRGWNFSHAHTIHYNNYGFLNTTYYDPVAETPLVAVIGDGNVEAMTLPFEETLQGRLTAQLGIDGRAYSFAGAGAPLSQYPVWAQFARDEFKPDGFVFSVARDDFDESLAKYTNTLGLHHYHETTDGYELRLRPYQPTVRGDSILRHSALARYLTLNLRLLGCPSQHSATQETDALDASATEPEARLEESKAIAKVFLDELPDTAGVEPSRILFLVSGMRPELYSEDGLQQAQGSYWDLMRDFFMEEAAARGYETIDMQPILIEHHRQTGERFEYPTDGHWNGIAHGLAAQTVADSKLYAALFEKTPVETVTFEPTPAEVVIVEVTSADAVIPEASPSETDLSKEYPID